MIKIKLKEGVRLEKLSPQIVLAIQVIAGMYACQGLVEMVITSANDSKHKEGSKHYSGNAVDIRTNNISVPTVRRILDDVKASLDENFDVIFESPGTANSHLHVEYDPK